MCRKSRQQKKDKAWLKNDGSFKLFPNMWFSKMHRKLLSAEMYSSDILELGDKLSFWCICYNGVFESSERLGVCIPNENALPLYQKVLVWMGWIGIFYPLKSAHMLRKICRENVSLWKAAFKSVNLWSSGYKLGKDFFLQKAFCIQFRHAKFHLNLKWFLRWED